ncbi:HAD-superfamily hydrolase [Viridothelium virens]|uniref:HAD-superfamily hydrolase n=1 Tax=Viridothelium virens TaxID=1048519 RepID=A0A6A6HG62_VIRVR|nr:HAD-superfamily hydrolase [Viridothelium virens]
MPMFEDDDFCVDRPISPPKSPELHRVQLSDGYRSSRSNPQSPNADDGLNRNEAIEVPATRSFISDAQNYMHNLSLSPSMKDRRGSRNSLGTSLPIPSRESRRSMLSWYSAVPPHDGCKACSSMPPAQPTREILASQLQDISSSKVAAVKDMAFVFDIDGVLVHGDRLIPEGQRVLQILNGDNELGIKIPHIFLTNGSGKLEQTRVDQLSKILKSPISIDQFIQSHTPMSALAEYYSTVLVVGGEGYRCREVAYDYGFRNVIIPHDVVAWDPTIAPYRTPTPSERRAAWPQDFSQTNIEAIMVFSDSRDYATDMQIIVDLLRSEHGRLGTVAQDPVAQRIPIYFSQGDLLCPTEHPIPRMSQGAFRIGLEAMYKALTGVDLERVIYGKPELATYKYADEVIAGWLMYLHGEEKLPKNIYMIGDNPASDIVGGNMYGWNTCLVRTGVYQGEGNDRDNPASFGVFKNVLEAVETAIGKELGKDFKLE